jgi:hypothetical protein
MTAMPSAFDKPIRQLRAESLWLEKEFLRAVSSGSHRHTQLTCEMAIIRLHDAWARFCRRLIILSAFGRTTTLGGVRLPPCSAAITKQHLVIPTLLSKYKRRSIEPRWADATECIDAGKRLAIGNLGTVAAALGAINSPAEDMRRIRNFYAHRGMDTARDALATKLFSRSMRPDSFDLAVYTSGGNRVIESWTSNLAIVAVAACQ